MRTTITLLCAALSVSACGSIIRGGDQDVTFTSEPSGAQVILANGQQCVTPCALALDRFENHDGEVVLGQRKEPVDIDSTFGFASAGVLASNVLLFGGVGLIVDAVSGAMFELDTREVAVDFTAHTGTAQVAPAVASFSNATDTPAGLSFYEGASLSAIPQDVRQSYCDAGWDRRIDQFNRTEYNPCTQASFYAP